MTSAIIALEPATESIKAVQPLDRSRSDAPILEAARPRLGAQFLLDLPPGARDRPPEGRGDRERLRVHLQAYAALDARLEGHVGLTSIWHALAKERWRLDEVCMNAHMNSRNVINALEADGWVKVAQRGSHVQLKHPQKPGRVTVPYPKRDLPVGTLRSIEKQADLQLR